MAGPVPGRRNSAAGPRPTRCVPGGISPRGGATVGALLQALRAEGGATLRAVGAR